MLSAQKMSLHIKFHVLVNAFSFPLAGLGYKPNDVFSLFSFIRYEYGELKEPFDIFSFIIKRSLWKTLFS